MHKDIYRGGKRLVSVTELQSLINKPFLQRWKESLCNLTNGECGFQMAQYVADEASQLGNTVHEYVEAYLNGQGFTINEVSSAEEWADKIIKVLEESETVKYLIEPEHQLIDEKSGLAGKPDAVTKDKYGNEFITDYKIKNQLDPLSGLQGYGYRYLINRLYKTDIRFMQILWCQKKSKGLKVKQVLIDLDQWKAPFEALATLWNVVNPSRKVVLHGL